MKGRNYMEEFVYTMPREVDHHVAKRIAMELDRRIEIEGIRSIVFDMKDTVFLDSSGIGVVIGRSRKLKYFEDGQVKVINISPRVDLIFQSAGIYKIVRKEGNDE